MSKAGRWTLNGRHLDANGRALRPEWYCANCTVWYPTRGTDYCPTCDGVLERVSHVAEVPRLFVSERDLAERVGQQLDKTSTQEVLALAAQVEYLETQRRHLLGQAKAIDDWLKHLREGAAKREPVCNPFWGDTRKGRLKTSDDSQADDARLLAKARRYGLDTFALKGTATPLD